MVNLLISLILAYLIGSIPTSYMVAKVFKKKDIRREGSGNVGATNVFRVVGKLPAVFVLLFDVFKGVACVAFLPEIFFNNTIGITMGLGPYKMLLGACVIAGHVWSAFLKLRGGKGVATTAGVLLLLAPKVLIGSLVIWGIVFSVSRVVSVASITAAIFLPVFAIIFNQPIHLVLFAALLCIMATYKHKANIRRLLRGQERKLFLLALLFSFVLAPCGEAQNLYSKFKDTPVIKVCLKEVKSEAEGAYVKASVFRDIFEEVLPKRINISFKAVQNPAEAHVVMTATIKKYSFRKRVMPTFYNAWAIVADITAMKSGGKLVVDYRILDPADGSLLAEFRNFVTNERRPIDDMTGDKAFKHAAAKNINRFLYRAFYKQRKRGF